MNETPSLLIYTSETYIICTCLTQFLKGKNQNTEKKNQNPEKKYCKNRVTMLS